MGLTQNTIKVLTVLTPRGQSKKQPPSWLLCRKNKTNTNNRRIHHIFFLQLLSQVFLAQNPKMMCAVVHSLKKNIRRLLLLPTYGYFLSYYYPPLPLWCDLLLLPFNSLLFIIFKTTIFITIPYYIYYKRNFSQSPLQRKRRKKIPAGSGVVPYISIN